jgi:acetylornithine deacetylase/succinyl-diaminopimelate desuccinylase-like protein
MDLSVADLKKWYETHQDEIYQDFFSFLRFKGISTDPSFKKDCLATADFLVQYLNNIRMQTQLWTNPGLPVVYAEHKVSDQRPTVLIYHHYDVQPVDPIELWKTDPFEPKMIDGKVFARGASDNKGQCFATLTALKVCLQSLQQLDVNIKLFIEGEEESGGAGTQITLEEKKKFLQADYVLVVDFDMPKVNVPGITLGMRGIATFNLEFQNSKQDLHSGVHGGIALNPLRALADTLSKMWDENGTISIEHFYDDIKAIPSEDLKKLDLSFDVKSYQNDFGVKAFCNEKGKTLKESNWLRPTLEINGIWGGYTGVGFKTVIPAKAFAKISCRLVPDQDPKIIEKNINNFLQKNVPPGIDWHLEAHHGAKAFRANLRDDIVKIVAISQSEVFAREPEYTLCGASVPIVTDLARVSGGQIALFGTSLSSDDFHSPNEHFALERFKHGFLTMSRILINLSNMKGKN